MSSAGSLLLPAWSPSDPDFSISQDSQITIKPRDSQNRHSLPQGREDGSPPSSVNIDDAMDLDDEDYDATGDSNLTSAFSDDSDEEEESKSTSSTLFSTSAMMSTLSRTLHKSVSNSSLRSNGQSLRSKLSTPTLKFSMSEIKPSSLNHSKSSSLEFSDRIKVDTSEMERSSSTTSIDSNATSRPPRTPPAGRSFLPSPTGFLWKKKRHSPPPARKQKLRTSRSFGSLREKVSALSPLKSSFGMSELLCHGRELVLRNKELLVQKGLLDACEKCGEKLESTRRLWVETTQVLCQECCESKAASTSYESKMSTLDHPSPSKLSSSPRQSININMSRLISKDTFESSNYSSEDPNEVSFIQMDDSSSSLFPFGRLQPGFSSKCLISSSIDDAEMETDNTQEMEENDETPKARLISAQQQKKKSRPWLTSKRSYSEGQMKDFNEKSKKSGINLSKFFSSSSMASAPLSHSAPERFSRQDLYISRPGSNSGFAIPSSQSLGRRSEDVDMKDWNEEERLNKYFLNVSTIILGKLGMEGGELVVLEES